MCAGEAQEPAYCGAVACGCARGAAGRQHQGGRVPHGQVLNARSGASSASTTCHSTSLATRAACVERSCSRFSLYTSAGSQWQGFRAVMHLIWPRLHTVLNSKDLLPWSLRHLLSAVEDAVCMSECHLLQCLCLMEQCSVVEISTPSHVPSPL